jgi:hypothetical protein
MRGTIGLEASILIGRGIDVKLRLHWAFGKFQNYFKLIILNLFLYEFFEKFTVFSMVK